MHEFAIGASFITTGLDVYILKQKQRVVPFISPIQSLRNVGINKFSIVRLFQGWISSHVIYRALAAIGLGESQFMSLVRTGITSVIRAKY